MDRIECSIFYLLILLLPTQLGKHFWPGFTIVSGIRIDYLSPVIYVTDILLVLLLGCFVYRWVKTNIKPKGKVQRAKVKFNNKKYIFILSFLLIFFIVNIVFSLRPLLSFYGFVKFSEFAFFAFSIAKKVTYRFQLQQITLLFAISSIFESLLAIFQYLHQGSINGVFYFFGERTFTGMTPGIANASIGGALILRPYGTFPHPNVLAGYLLIGMVLVWSFLFKNTKRWMQVIGIVSFFVSNIALLLTFSRVAILLWILLVLVVLVRTLVQITKTRRSKIIVIATALVCVAIFSLTPLAHEVTTRFAQASLSDESVTERTELLVTAATLIKQHPLLGVGLYNFIPAMSPLQKPLPLGLYLQPVHNIFMLVAAETGLIGLGLFVGMLAITIKRIASLELRIKRTFMVLLLIILLTGMFDHYWITLQQGQLLFAMVIGLIWAKKEKQI